MTNTADTGLGSLRQAILDANGSPGSTITFSIGSGVATIRPLSQLPHLVSGTIDGATQPGYSGSPLIEIDGSLLPAITRCLVVGGGPTHVKSLVVNRCSFRGIEVTPQTIVTSSFIGTDVTGTVARPNGVGVFLAGNGSVIGGYLPAARNVISGNAYGIIVGLNGGAVIGNYVGLNAAGTAALPNANAGISVQYSSGVTIASNVISGNTQYGIELFYATESVIVGNVIGPSPFGSALPAAQRAGIDAYESTVARIGGLALGEPNTIAYNDVGVAVEAGSRRIRIAGNSIHSNGFGIDLNYDSQQTTSRVTPNDSDDADVGANLLQNFPVIESAYSAQGSATIRGTLHSSATSSFRVEFFSNAACNGSGYGEGRTYIGFANATTDSSGNASFETVVPVAILPSEVVTATATDEFGNTSEFSACKPVGLKFFTLEPCRVIDTRNPDGPLEGPVLFAQSSRLFALANACGIPANAVSVSVNLVVTQATAAGHLTIHPPETGTPVASNINFAAGRTRANNAILRVSSDGSGIIVVVNAAPGTVHFILDVTGFFR